MEGWSEMLPLVEFTYNSNYHSSIGMASYGALYGRRCRTTLCWNQDSESLVLGPEFLQQTSEKVKAIQEQMRATQSKQKLYANKRRRPLEFEAGDHVFLRVTPTAGIGRAIKSRKLTLRKYIADPSHVLESDDIQIREDLTVNTRPMQILDSQVKKLRGKEIRTMKVL
ncbi:uncharacterized protein LOC114194846 [Vigna unguiculata]|uniref:uncharacterized protein LOC114194846 n=1 Tax=Vigna unguiculata TaxID=3917 RepID=UPI00101703BF|nr:uncharacterized protein LOC114194846 [Vigna unguiculata]